MDRLRVALIAVGLFIGAAALVAACDVSPAVEEGDSGGGGDAAGTDGGGPADTGGHKDAGQHEDVPLPGDDAETADAGGDTGPVDHDGSSPDAEPADGATGDDGGPDGGVKDTGPQGYSVSGTVTIEGKKPVHLTAAVLLDKAPAQGVAPVAFAVCDADGAYTIDTRCDSQGQNCAPLGAGTYWVAAIYDINNDSQIDPNTGDVYAFYIGNPVTLPGPSTGIDIDITLIQAAVTTVYIDAIPPQVPTAGAYLTNLGATVRNPADGTVIEDAVVKVTDGVSPTVYTLVWDATQKGYLMDRSGAQQLIPAVDGTYEFTVTHSAFGAGPVIKTIRHRPFTAAVKITAPANNVQYNTPQDVTVAWTDPPTALPMMVQAQEAKQNGQTVYEKPAQGTQATVKSPETIPAASFDAASNYVVRVISGRVVPVPAGASNELAMGQVVVSFK